MTAPVRTRTAFQRQGDRCMRRNRTRFDATEIHIYAFLDESDHVVYVGRTWDPQTRIGAHRQRSPWWSPSLNFALIETVVGWPDAVAAEASAIASLRPLHNVQHNQRAVA